MVRLGNTVRDVFSITAIGQNAVTALGHDQCRASVLTHGQHAAGSHVGVLEQIQCDVLVISRCFGIFQDFAQLGEVCWAQVIVDFLIGGVGQELECLRRDRSEGVLTEGDRFNAFVTEQSPVVVRGLAVQDLVFALVHHCLISVNSRK